MSNPSESADVSAPTDGATDGAASCAQATSASTQSSGTTMPSLPPVANSAAAAAPRETLEVSNATYGLMRQFGCALDGAIRVVSSPFRGSRNNNNSATANNTTGSPNENSVDVSELTNPSTLQDARESTELVINQANLDYAQTGDGGDSDDEGEEADIHNASVRLAAIVTDFGPSDEDLDLDYNDEGEQFIPAPGIPGAPLNWEPPKPPATFLGYTPKPNSGAPATFEEVDNPGKWDEYMFQPKYNGSTYVNHFTPSGAKVLPAGEDGKRSINGWDFHYNGWDGDDISRRTFKREGATLEDIKPSCRRGILDVELLKKHGINSDTFESPIHWYNLLFPIGDPEKSGIENDGRMPYYTEARAATNIYAFGEKGFGGGYSHTFNPVTEQELVRFAGIPIRHGARGGSPAQLHYRFIRDDMNYDETIANSLTYSRYRQVKSVFKLSNNMVHAKRGQPDYDPCNKYDLVVRALCHNMNYFTEFADMDFGLDESSWGFMGYMAECGGRLKNKPFSKGSCHALFVLHILSLLMSLFL